jgi:hypothetical protein
MAYDDADRVDENTSRIKTADSVQANIRAAAKTFGENMITYQTTGGLGAQELQRFRDDLIDLLRGVDARLVA